VKWIGLFFFPTILPLHGKNNYLSNPLLHPVRPVPPEQVQYNPDHRKVYIQMVLSVPFF